MGQRSDEELMAAYADGDRAAFDEIFARYGPVLMRIMGKQLPRMEDAWTQTPRRGEACDAQ